MATNDKQPIAEAGIDQSEEEEQIDIEMPRLPDIALRQIFSNLGFSDIKSCRLVSTQWHRFALDSFNFVLSIQRLPQPGISERPASVFLDTDDVNRHGNRLALFPYAKTLGQSGAKQILNRVGDETMKHTSEPFYFHQLPHVINETFARKIKHVILQDFKPIILPVLDTLAQMLPAAEHVKAIDYDADDSERVLWLADFEKLKETGDFRCRYTDLYGEDVDPAKSIVPRLLYNDAHFIVRIIAESWSCVQQTIAAIEANNYNQPLVFDNCRQLSMVNDSSQAAGPPIRSIVAHFPQLGQLDCKVGHHDSADDITSLQQLTSLKRLNIRNANGNVQQQLPPFCLPNLAELNLSDGILLCANPGHSNWSGLKELSLEANLWNMMHLREYVHLHGGRGCLSNLTELATRHTPANAELIVGFHTIMLAAANNLQHLEMLQFVPVHFTPVLPQIYTATATHAPGLKSLTFGFIRIPNDDAAFDCRGLVQQLVDDVKQRSPSAAITVRFLDNSKHAMVSAMAEAGVGGVGVTISMQPFDEAVWPVRDYDLTWRNDATGSQQKLSIQVANQAADY